MPAKNFLNNLTIPSPCNADWDSMVGNDRVRFCEHCKFDVHNLSTMTQSQAERLVTRAKGRVCVRYHHDDRGKPLTLPVSQKLHRIGRRVSRIAAGAFTATLSVSSAVAQQTASVESGSTNSPVVTEPVTRWTQTARIAGKVRNNNGGPISGATISLFSETLSSGLYVSSDVSGKFRVENLAPGFYQVRIEAPGFAAQESQYYARENRDTAVQVVLLAPTLQEIVSTEEINSIRLMSTGGVVAFISPEDPFISAAQEDDLETFTALIAGRDVNLRDKQSGTTALEHAVKNGNREMLNLLIAAGAQVNTKDETGETPLMMFDDDATSDLIWDLINAGAEVNAKDENGNTPLIRAAMVNNLEALKALIEAGAKLNDQNKYGLTALMHAASEGEVNMVRALVIAGADINLLDADGTNALGMALTSDHSAVVRYLKSRGAAEVAAKDKHEKEKE